MRIKIVSMLIAVSYAILSGCGSPEVTSSDLVKAEAVHKSFHTTYDANEGKVRHMAIFRANSQFGDAIELKDPAAVSVAGTRMRGVNSQTANAALGILIPIPFLFLSMPGFYYTSEQQGITHLESEYSYTYTDADGKTESFSVDTKERISFTDLNTMEAYSRDAVLSLATSLPKLDRDVSVSCVLTAKGVDQSVVKSARAEARGDRVYCVWDQKQISEVQPGDALVELSVSRRWPFAQRRGSRSYTYVAPKTKISLQ